MSAVLKDQQIHIQKATLGQVSLAVDFYAAIRAGIKNPAFLLPRDQGYFEQLVTPGIKKGRLLLAFDQATGDLTGMITAQYEPFCSESHTLFLDGTAKALELDRAARLHQTAQVCSLLVHPGYKGQNLGQRLIAEVEAQMQTDNITHAFAFTALMNQRARKTFEDSGYQVIATSRRTGVDPSLRLNRFLLAKTL